MLFHSGSWPEQVRIIINLLHIANRITLRNNNYEGWLYFMIEGSWLLGKFHMVREICLSGNYLLPNSFRKQDIFNPSVGFVIPKWGRVIPVTCFHSPKWDSFFFPEGVCIPQLRLLKLTLRPGHLQNGQAVTVLAPRKLQSIIYNFKASFKTFHSAGVRPPVPILWQTEKHLLRNPLQRWKATRSLT